MEPTPYASPHGIEPANKIQKNIRPHWALLCIGLLAIAISCFMLYLAIERYLDKGFVGGDGMPAIVVCGLPFVVWPAMFVNGCYCLWCALFRRIQRTEVL